MINTTIAAANAALSEPPRWVALSFCGTVFNTAIVIYLRTVAL